MTNESQGVLLPSASSILGALQATKNFRAALLTALVLIVTALFAGVVVYAGGRAGSVALIFIGMLFTYLIALYGISAVGFILMNEAKGASPLSIGDALMASLMSTHRWIAVILSALLVFVLFLVFVVLVLFVCKIPVLGPMLYTVVLPLATFATAIFLAALYFVVAPLAFPAVWTGDTVMQVFSKLWAIFRQRLAYVVVRVLLLVLLCAVVSGIIASLVFSALAIVGSLSTAILPGFGQIGRMPMMGGFMGGGFNGYMFAGVVGGGIVLAVVMIVPFLILFQGYCLIYLDVIQGMDFSAAEAQLKSQMENIQRKARETQEKIKERAEQVRASQASAASAPTPPPAAPAAAPTPARPVAPPPQPAAPAPAPVVAKPAPAPACPQCKTPISSDDLFCGSCGFKLR